MCQLGNQQFEIYFLLHFAVIARGRYELLCIEIVTFFFYPNPFQCRALAKRLAIAEKNRETLSEEVRLANQNITRLQVRTGDPEFTSSAFSPSRSNCALPAQDELATTKRSYEDQLSMMSDHLCSMNETLSKQREEIDTLKLGSKVKTVSLRDVNDLLIYYSSVD